MTPPTASAQTAAFVARPPASLSSHAMPARCHRHFALLMRASQAHEPCAGGGDLRRPAGGTSRRGALKSILAAVVIAMGGSPACFRSPKLTMRMCNQSAHHHLTHGLFSYAWKPILHSQVCLSPHPRRPRLLQEHVRR